MTFACRSRSNSSALLLNLVEEWEKRTTKIEASSFGARVVASSTAMIGDEFSHCRRVCRAAVFSPTWSGIFSASVPGVSVQWQWGAAVYTRWPAPAGVFFAQHPELCDASSYSAHSDCKSNLHELHDFG
jgi:hypothetical protein